MLVVLAHTHTQSVCVCVCGCVRYAKELLVASMQQPMFETKVRKQEDIRAQRKPADCNSTIGLPPPSPRTLSVPCALFLPVPHTPLSLSLSLSLCLCSSFPVSLLLLGTQPVSLSSSPLTPSVSPFLPQDLGVWTVSRSQSWHVLEFMKFISEKQTCRCFKIRATEFMNFISWRQTRLCFKILATYDLNLCRASATSFAYTQKTRLSLC